MRWPQHTPIRSIALFHSGVDGRPVGSTERREFRSAAPRMFPMFTLRGPSTKRVQSGLECIDRCGAQAGRCRTANSALPHVSLRRLIPACGKTGPQPPQDGRQKMGSNHMAGKEIRTGRGAYHAGVAVAVVASFLTVWTTIVRDDGNGMGFFMVIMAVAVGWFAASFRPAGMARTMLGVAIMQAMVGILIATAPVTANVPGESSRLWRSAASSQCCGSSRAPSSALPRKASAQTPAQLRRRGRRQGPRRHGRGPVAPRISARPPPERSWRGPASTGRPASHRPASIWQATD